MEKEHAGDAPAESRGRNNSELQHLLHYVTPPLRSLERGWERNCLLQAALITLGLLKAYNHSTLVEEVAGFARISVGSADVLIPVVLTYLFVRLGYLTNAYLFKRAIFDKIWSQSHLPEGFTLKEINKAFRSDFIIEMLYTDFQKQGAAHHSPFLLFKAMLALVFALNHAVVALYLHHEFRGYPIAFVSWLIALLALVVSLHVQFIKTTSPDAAKWNSKVVLILMVPLYGLLQFTSKF